ncbi:DUF305 domain-containing protein [Pseudonocardia nigra]|uniref:DUF305 domain-containing protein n=1 Tax=Pseudonocardia nigra TaxID=1921578 RepID=UPI001C601745|nr:DUF305 domain-containing protein [Pseudonocardia nigra]
MEPRRSRLRRAGRTAPALPAAALVVLLGGCSGAGAAVAVPSGAVQPTPPPVVVPGAPGEPARVMPGEEAAALLPDAAPTEADIRFLQRMIPHHQQALDMAALAPGRVADPAVAAIADRIRAAQGPEIAVMQSLLAEHGHAGHSGHGGHDHADMPGMATEAQLAELAAASGPAFDRLFLTLMIAHHEGALTMVEELLTGGRDIRVGELAQGIAVTQATEIERMRALLPE